MGLTCLILASGIPAILYGIFMAFSPLVGCFFCLCNDDEEELGEACSTWLVMMVGGLFVGGLFGVGCGIIVMAVAEEFWDSETPDEKMAEFKRMEAERVPQVEQELKEARNRVEALQA